MSSAIAPSVVPTSAPSHTNITAFIQYYPTFGCNGVSTNKLNDNGVCGSTPTTFPTHTYGIIVTCESNSPNSPWTASYDSVSNGGVCSFTTSTYTGTGACNECTNLINGISAHINCGASLNPMCSAAPTVAPTTMRPSANPTFVPSALPTFTPAPTFTAAPTLTPAPTFTAAPTVTVTAPNLGYLVVYSGNKNCNAGVANGGNVPLDQCVAMGYSGRYAKFHCNGFTASSTWSAVSYQDSNCLSQIDSFSGNACTCEGFTTAAYQSYSMGFTCGSGTPSCASGSSSSSSSSSSGGAGGIIGGVVGAILGIALIFAISYFYFGARERSARAAAQANARNNATAATAATGAPQVAMPVDVELANTANPMTPSAPVA